MSTDRSRAGLFKFLDYMATKGLAPANTIASRKASANKILEILSDDEAGDVTNLNIEELMHRFANLRGQGYAPDSLNTYKSRLTTALDDFSKYMDNPLGFKPNRVIRERTQKAQIKPNESIAAEKNAVKNQVFEGGLGVSKPPVSDTIFPIHLRQNLIVYVQGLPFDLTKGEATKIANVIMAHVAFAE